MFQHSQVLLVLESKLPYSLIYNFLFFIYIFYIHYKFFSCIDYICYVYLNFKLFNAHAVEQ